MIEPKYTVNIPVMKEIVCEIPFIDTLVKMVDFVREHQDIPQDKKNKAIDGMNDVLRALKSITGQRRIVGSGNAPVKF